MYLHTNGFGGYPKNLERLLASTTGSSQASNVSQIPWVETIQLSSLGETRSLFLKCSALDDTKCDKVLGCGALTRWFWAAPGSPPRGFFEVRTFPLEEEIGWWQMKEVVKKPLWHLPWLGMCLFIVWAELTYLAHDKCPQLWYNQDLTPFSELTYQQEQNKPGNILEEVNDWNYCWKVTHQIMKVNQSNIRGW